MPEAVSAFTFLSTLYDSEAPGVLSIFCLPSKRTLWQPATQIRRLLQETKPYLDGQDIYFSLGLREHQLADGRGDDTDVVAIPGLWADLDVADPVHKAQGLPPDRAAVEGLLAGACPFAPSIVMHSGHGLQAYWLFRELWVFDDAAERTRARELCHRLQASIQAQAKHHGWHVDSTFDLARVFRLPGTMNRKSTPVPVHCLTWEPLRRYSPGDFDDVLPPLSAAPPPHTGQGTTPAPPLQQLPLSTRLKYLLRVGEDPQDLARYPSRSEATFAVMMAMVGGGLSDTQMAQILLNPSYALSEKPRERGEKWLLQEIARVRGKYRPDMSHPPYSVNGTTAAPPHPVPRLDAPETLTELMAADIPPPRQLFPELMHEGMLLFGGKSKRGKSWLMFDLALSLAVGRAGFRHFACPAPMPILYLALEDGRARLQGRVKAIQPNLTTADDFHLRYTFPAFGHGGIEALTEEILRYHYGLVVIDVLGKLESTPAGKSDRNYHDIYEMFTPLQELRKQHPFCLAMLTHLRKQEADDVFDSLLGSVAYQGAQDVLWVLERKPKDDFAFLHIRDKDAEDKTIALRFLDGHWEYIGEGEEYEVSRDNRKIIQVLTEEKRDMSIADIMKGAGFPEHKYAYVRNVLVSLVKDDFIHRTKQGRYSATVRGAHEFVHDDGLADYDDGRYGH